MEALIKHADIAMYKAKESGRNTWYRYDSETDHRSIGNFDLENDLRHAVRLESLELHYQPLRDLLNGRWTGVEALLRWNHLERSPISPADFIPVAGETGLIVDIGYWVIRQVCRQYQAWKRRGLTIPIITVNRSPHQFLQGNLVERVEKLIKSCHMPTECLGIEVTESAAMPNFDYSVKTLEAFRAMGLRLYLDDFGTGFSSLSHLRRLPFDVLKIDREFIPETPANADAVAIVRAIIAMAKNLNMTVVAEGIETEEQMDFLRAEGCHFGQGYHLARALPPDALLKLPSA